MSLNLDDVRRRIFAARELHGAYQRVFSSPDGQRVLLHLAKKFNIFTAVHVKGDPHETAFNDGQRLVVLSIIKHVNKDPQKLLQQLEQGVSNEDSI